MMQRRPIAVAAAAGALAIGGTAIAAPNGGPIGPLFGADRDEAEAEFSRDLASKLGNGVTPEQVEKALDEVRSDRESEMRTELAKALSAKLDASVDDVEKALAKAENQAKQSFRRGERPRGDFVETLANELDKSESDVRSALEAVHRDRLNARLDELVKDGRLTKEQADGIRERSKDGPPAFGPGFRHVRPAPGGPGPGGFVVPAPGPGALDGPAGPPPPG